MSESAPDRHYDYVVVGAGPAGCVLASRLSADPAVTVLLVEAGPDLARGQAAERVLDAGFRAHFDSSLFTSYFPVVVGRNSSGIRRRPYRQPQVLGGGSSVNGMHAQRGTPSDYDDWKQYGVEGWSWADLLSYFCRCEADADFHNHVHGASGPLPIARIPESEWSRFAVALRCALEAQGIPRRSDLNAPDEGPGVGPVPLNISGYRRVSTVAAYLDGTVRARGNLTIMTGTKVLKVRSKGRRAVGIDALCGAGTIRVDGDEIILCAGALESAGLLLRSGIGPGSDLRACGIPVVSARKGVGASLRNHIHISLTAHLAPAARLAPSRRPPAAMVTRYSSQVEGCEQADMLLNLWERLPGALQWDPLGQQMAVLMLLANKTYSAGQVRLNPRDPSGNLDIDFNILSDARDLDRMALGLQMIGSLVRHPTVAPLVNHVFFASPGRLMHWLTQYDARATLLSASGSVVLGANRSLAKSILSRMGPSLDAMARTADSARAAAMQLSQPASHATSTCRMGRPDDDLAVTDSRCRVIGIEKLRVVDGSIFPAPIRAGTHLPIIMAAEKAVDMIREDRRR